VGTRQNQFFPRESRFDKQLMRKQQKEYQMALKLRPIGDRFLVEAIEEEKENGRKGGIIIPDTAKEAPMESLVVAVGTGKTSETARRSSSKLKKVTASSSAIWRHGNQTGRQGIQDLSR